MRDFREVEKINWDSVRKIEKEQTNSERSGVEIKQGKSRKHKTDNQVGTVRETDIVIFER